MGGWDASAHGVLRLPSGRLVRGRGLRQAFVADAVPEFGLYLLVHAPPAMAWQTRWVRWPDFRLPVDELDALSAFREAWQRAETNRVEVACAGGRGRTGTALACMAVLDGMSPRSAITFVRRRYDHRAVETPQQKRYVRRFPRV